MQEKKLSKAKIVLILGLTGIFGVLLTIISDLILLGRPVTAQAFFELGTESMAGISQWRITAGTFIGVFMLPLQLAGLVSLFHGLKPSGRFLPAFIILVYAHALIMGVAFHSSYAYIGSGWKLFYNIGSGNLHTAEIMQRFNSYWTLILIIMVSELVLGSTAFIIQVLRGKTLYPRWMAILSPLCVFAAMLLIILRIPAPVGGYIGPTILNISTLTFFILSTVMIYRKLKQQENV